MLLMIIDRFNTLATIVNFDGSYNIPHLENIIPLMTLEHFKHFQGLNDS